MSPDPDRVGGALSVSLAGFRGLRDERADPEALQLAVSRHLELRGEVLKDDARSLVTATATPAGPLVVKEVRKGGLRRRLADSARGAPSRRAFTAGRRLIACGIGAALPLATLERRRLGVPLRSLLVSVDLREHPTAAVRLEREPEARPAVLAALAELLLSLHAAGARHGDLRAQHAHLRTGPEGRLRALLLDLEGVRFGSANDDDPRLEDWAQVGGSIPDAHASLAQRREAFARYAARMPFDRGAGEAFEQMTERAVRRGHLYRGTSDREPDY